MRYNGNLDDSFGFESSGGSVVEVELGCHY